MRFLGARLAWVFWAPALVFCSAVYSMDLHIGSDGTQFISPGNTWRFFRGKGPASEPPEAWKDPNFDDSQWEEGPSGFGYGDNDDATVLNDMQGHYVSVYVRREFTVAPPARAGGLELTIDYDDGFIAYLNGREVARRGMPAGAATYQTLASASHEAGTAETISLGAASDWLREGRNVLAIEGHNNALTSSDLSLIPALRAGLDVLRNGDRYILMTDTVMLDGQTHVTGVTSIVITGMAADFDPADGTWHAVVSLLPGLNTITAQALNAAAHEVDSGSIEIIYVPPAHRLTGDLDKDVTLSGAYFLDHTVTVPAGRILTIEPGTMILFQEGARLTVRGQLRVEGSPAEPICFTRAGNNGYWLGLQFDQTSEDNCIRHALLEYARTDDGMIGLQKSRLLVEDTEFDHCDRRRIRTLDSSLTVRRCRFDDMFGPSEPPTTDNMSENIWGSGIPDGGWLVVEDCVFGRNKGHNDGIDFDGPASPKPIPHIRHNTFLGGADDALDLECDALIEGNLFMNFVRDKYNKASGESNILSAGAGKHYTLTHNIFLNSQHIAQVKDNAFLTFINNTAINISGAAIYFELGLPGRKPGRGAAVANSIFWTTPITFEGISDQTAFAVNYSLLPRKWHRWGTGNIEADPLFVKAGYWDQHGTPNNPDDDTWMDGDYHLKSQAGRWDAGKQRWMEDDVTSPCIDAGDPNADWTAELWPHGRRINMGAYGGTAQASMSLSNADDAADLNHDGAVDARDLLVLANGWLIKEAPLAQDMSRDGSVNLLDLSKLAGRWRLDLASEQGPFDIVLGARAKWSGPHEGYDPNLPGYRIDGDIASVTLRARSDDLPAQLILAIRTSPHTAPMLEDFTLAAPCVLLSGAPFQKDGLTYSQRADSSLSWEAVPEAATDTYFKFDVVGDEVHVTFLPAAIELLRVQCRVSWIDRYR